MKGSYMKTHTRTIRIAGLSALLLTSVANVDASTDSAQTSTSIMEVQLSTRSAAAPLEMRVSVQYVNSNAPEMLRVLAKAAGLTVEVPSTPLQPVTITLTNVRLRTALDAICDTASCTWRLEGTTLKLASAGASNAAGQLPPTVSIEVNDVPVREVFRAIAAAINVPVTVEGNVERPPVTVKFSNASTNTVLDFICKNAGCTWTYDGTSLNVRFRAP
jgi:hypothetical protein